MPKTPLHMPGRCICGHGVRPAEGICHIYAKTLVKGICHIYAKNTVSYAGGCICGHGVRPPEGICHIYAKTLVKGICHIYAKNTVSYAGGCVVPKTPFHMPGDAYVATGAAGLQKAYATYMPNPVEDICHIYAKNTVSYAGDAYVATGCGLQKAYATYMPLNTVSYAGGCICGHGCGLQKAYATYMPKNTVSYARHMPGICRARSQMRMGWVGGCTAHLL